MSDPTATTRDAATGGPAPDVHASPEELTLRRLARLYDHDNPAGADHDFVADLAARRDARRVLDVGCGSGLLTVRLAGPGRTVLGVDPDAHALAVARSRPGHDGVTWLDGDSSVLAGRPERFDFALMTANVAQHIPDPQWQRTLHDVAAVTDRGATLVFETRHPQAAAWRHWTDPGSSRLTDWGRLHESCEVTELAADRVLARFGNRFEDLDREVIVEQEFAFRDRGTLTDQLDRAGFDVEGVSGDWDGSPVVATSPLLMVVARRR